MRREKREEGKNGSSSGKKGEIAELVSKCFTLLDEGTGGEKRYAGNPARYLFSLKKKKNGTPSYLLWPPL